MNPFSYEPGEGPLRTLSAAAKALALAFFAMAAMRLPLLPLSILTAAAALLPPLFGARMNGAWRGARSVLLLALAAALARGLLPSDTGARAGGGRLFAIETLDESLLYGLRLLAVFFLGSAYFSSTKASELGDSATRTARRFIPPARRGGLASDPGMLLGMTLAFLPRAFERYRRTREAAAVRGYGSGSVRPVALLAILERFLFGSIKDALAAAHAMELRGYDPERTLPEPSIGLGDVSLATAAAAIFTLSFFL